MELTFDDVARLPMPGDNVAIASRRLEKGTRIRRRDSVFELDFTVLHGHRFAVETIPAGDALLSWECRSGSPLVTSLRAITFATRACWKR